MRIQHNIMAMNAYRNLGINNKSLNKNLEKLSSGYRINRAGDDAAGLAISEKMRAQIAGLDQAQKNAQSGINLIQTAEGALTEVHDMLNRMVTLATQAANGTYGATEREKIQSEIDSLTEEINRIAENSNFNGKKLLDGTLGSGATEGAVEFEAADELADFGIESIDFGDLEVEEDTEVKAAYTHDGTNGTLTVTVGETAYTYTSADDADNIQGEITLADADGNEITVTLADGQDIIGDDGTTDVDEATVGAFATAEAEKTEAAGAFTAKEGVDLGDFGIESIDFGELEVTEETSVKAAYTHDATNGTLTVTVGETAYTYTSADDADNIQGEITLADADGNEITVTLADGQDIIGDDGTTDVDEAEIGTYAPAEEGAGAGLQLQIGADGAETINVTIDSMKADALGIKDLKVSDEKLANAAIKTINDAIEKVSVQRSNLGAYQNRLEHTINNLGVMEENIQDAEANIRDTDIADEMMAYTKNNILIQSAQAMLAQANQVPQGVLQLMQ